MNKREKNRLRTRVMERISAADLETAKIAWGRVFESRPANASQRDVETGRLAFLVALDEGKSIAQAERASSKALVEAVR